MTAPASKVMAGFILALVIVTAIPVATAQACTCADRSRAEQLSGATNIVRATVYDIRPITGRDYVSIEAEFQVSEVWKGSPKSRLKVYMHGLDESSCGIPLKKEHDYIVYVSSIKETNGDILPYIGRCGPTAEYSSDHAIQLDRELGLRSTIGITPTPRPILSPTPPLCPTVVAVNATPTPSTSSVLAFTAYFPAALRSSGVIAEPEEPKVLCRTPEPVDYSNPPGVIMIHEEGSYTGGQGSRCWRPINQCYDAPGIAAMAGLGGAYSPLEAFLTLLTVEEYPKPSSWQFWKGEASPSDYSLVPGEKNLWFWHPKELREVALDTDQHSIGPLDLPTGVVHVFKLRLTWGRSIEEPGALGWVEYGWALGATPRLHASHVRDHHASRLQEIVRLILSFR